ncbi:unnamed protein product [Trichobilharzia regenti]|nr:unnamed protein product [Trichobilharzia regenti]
MLNTLKGNMLITMMLDRLLAIQFPLKFSKLTSRHAWYFVLSTFVITALMIMPIIDQSDWSTFLNKIVCYKRSSNLFLYFYYGLFSGACFIQTTINGLLNGVLLLKITLWLRHRRKITRLKQTTKSNELAACILLLFVSGTTFLLSIPAASVMFFTITDPFSKDPIGAFIKLRIILNIREIFHILIYIQSIFNIIIYIWRMEHFRLLLMQSFQCRQFCRIEWSFKMSSSGEQRQTV